jgi:ribokinase
MDFIGFGALNFDRLFKVRGTARGDEEIAITDSSEAPGGSAANTIYALGRLGASCGFVGAVGRDSEGEAVLGSFDGVGVDKSGIVFREEARTGRVIGIVDPQGERTLYIAPGANSTLLKEDLDMDYVSQAKTIHMTSFVEDEQLELQKHVTDQLSSSGKIKISFAPGSLYAKKGLDAISTIIEQSYVLFLNEEEAKVLTGKEYEDASNEFLSTGCKLVAVTLRERGCYLADNNEKLHVPSVETKVVDTTGAGDAFCAGFLLGMSEGRTLRECGLIGNYVASLCISEIGARAGLPDRLLLEEGLKKML